MIREGDEEDHKRSNMPLRLKTIVEPHHQQSFCYLNAQPVGLAEKQYGASGQIVSSRLLHVSLAQRHEVCKTSRRSFKETLDLGVLDR